MNHEKAVFWGYGMVQKRSFQVKDYVVCGRFVWDQSRSLHTTTSTELLLRFWKSCSVLSASFWQLWQFWPWRWGKCIYLTSLHNLETEKFSIYVRSVNAIKWFRVLTFALSRHPDVYELHERCLTTLPSDELNRCKVQKHNSICSEVQWL